MAKVGVEHMQDLLGREFPTNLKEWLTVSDIQPDFPMNSIYFPHWYVYKDSNENRVQRDINQWPEKLELPENIQLPTGSLLRSGHLTTYRLPEGWFLAVDGGEFGGALWFLSENEPVKIGRANFNGFAQIDGNIFVIGGLAHMCTDRGYIHEIRKDPQSGRYERRQVVTLRFRPEAVVVHEGAFIILTPASLVKVSLDGKIDCLINSEQWANLMPNSMIADGDDLLIGMRGVVARVCLKSLPAKVEWLVPSMRHLEDCRQLRVGDEEPRVKHRPRCSKRRRLKILILQNGQFVYQACQGVWPGAKLHRFENGDDAIRALDRDPLDLIITDMVHPGVDGITFIREIRRKQPKAKIVCISDDGQKLAKEAGADYLFPKLFLLELVEFLKSLFPTVESP